MKGDNRHPCLTPVFTWKLLVSHSNWNAIVPKQLPKCLTIQSVKHLLIVDNEEFHFRDCSTMMQNSTMLQSCLCMIYSAGNLFVDLEAVGRQCPSFSPGGSDRKPSLVQSGV
ncbi:hypothetical protein QQF64_000141 [Cirrhinus molitorella]|uniref:Uncharacterized protein n=1 Tax=Cirrhinus molitorella TaxID=172907 RepID=A0ABR3NWD5_9TELE